MATPKYTKVVVIQDNDTLDSGGETEVAVIGGRGAKVVSGTHGLAYAGAGGQAKVVRYGIAIAGPKGKAMGGAGCVVCAYEGGSASGGDGSTAWARRHGPATTGAFGMAIANDSDATGGRASVATATCRTAMKATAHAASEGIAVVRSHPDLDPASRLATAYSTTGGIAVAFDGNSVKGDVGALLVAAYKNDGQIRFAVGVVDNVTLMANQTYTCDTNGAFVAV